MNIATTTSLNICMDYSQDIIIRVLLEDIKFCFFNIAIIVDFLVNATPLGHV